MQINNHKIQNMFSKKNLIKYQIIDYGIVNSRGPLSFNSLIEWVDKSFNGPLKYMSDDRKLKRKSYKSVYEDYKSSLVFLFPYHEAKVMLNDLEKDEQLKNKIGSYVLGFEGIDYHYVINEKLNLFMNDLKNFLPELEWSLVVDTKPVLERDLAYQANLGWFGKNSMLIHPDYGSYFLIGSVFLNLDLKDYLTNTNDRDLKVDHCGQCTACIDACPTDAIIPNKNMIDASKCISTFTIELFKDEHDKPKGMNGQSEFFGCDICQDVCPWNMKSLNLDRTKISNPEQIYVDDHKRESFWSKTYNKLIKNTFLTAKNEDIAKDLGNISNRSFRKLFKNTSFERTGRAGLLKNFK